jgi:PAS domain S-box-containing protein
MKRNPKEIPSSAAPLGVLAVVLMIVFLAELAVMFVLPVLLPSSMDEWLTALTDACLLTVAIAPLLWWVIIRPLRKIAVTERARASFIVETAAEGIITIDESGVVESFNRAAEEIFSCAAEEIVGEMLTTLMPERLVSKHRDAMRRYLETGESHLVGETVEVAGRRRDGSEVPLSLSVGAVNVGGRWLFTGILHDLTKQKQQELEQRNRARQQAAVAQLATGVAHEIRNPLTSVKMLVQAAREDRNGGTIEKEDLQVIEDEIRRMERSVQTFLDYARPPKPECRWLDVASIVRRAFALTEARADRQEVALTFDPPVAPVAVEADAEQMQQLLLNLTLNGLDAMPRGGELRVELEDRAEEQVELRVLDTGRGISPEVFSHLFEPFVTSKKTGVGLGLVISRRIAEDHGGTLTACDRPQGGACFVLTLPRAASPTDRNSDARTTSR